MNLRRILTSTLAAAALMGATACGDTETKVVTEEVTPECSATHPYGVCPTGERCLEGACVDAATLCSATNDAGTCPDGLICYGGGCVLESALCSATAPHGPCDDGKVCVSGACLDPATLCSATNLDGACPSGQTCYAGGCVLDTASCSATAPYGLCDAGKVCVSGACLDPATLCSATNLDGACPAGQTCFGGGCVLETALCGPAAPSGPCELGSVCVDGECVATASLCSANNLEGLCPTGETCTDGICAEPTVDPCTVHETTTQPTLGAHTAVSTKAIITVGGLQFKDSSGDGALDAYEDWRLNPLCRARDLVSKMSLAQKIGTMSEGGRVGSGTADGSIPDNVRAAIVDKHQRYTLMRVGSRSPAELAVYLNNLQELAETQPLGIPLTVTADPIHGFGLSTNASTGAQTLSDGIVVSAWPYPLGLGAANDPALTRLYGDTVRKEFMGLGFRWQLGPMVDLATEPRWARVQNTFGVNAYAVALHGRECIAGFQGVGDGGLVNGIAATMKHFPGAGPNEGGKDSHSYAGRYNVFPGGYFEYHQIPFQAAIDVGAASVMPCYSIFKEQFEYAPEQIAAGFSYTLITEYLKEQMGFDGMVTGDWGTLGHAYNAEGIPVALRAAMWVQAGSHQFGSDSESNFMDAYNAGYLTEPEIDGAVEKILEMTFKLGLFENPYVDPTAATVRTPEHRGNGFIAQKKAIVILKNGSHESTATSAKKFLPIDGARYTDANSNSAPDPGEYIGDTNGDGVIKVYFDGVNDGLVANPDKPDAVTDLYGEYNYTKAATATSLAIASTTSYADADIAILRISARKGVYFGLDAGVPLSFDGAFPGTSTDSTIAASIKDRNRVIDALRARDGYTNAAGEAVAPVNPSLRIVLVMHMDRPGIVRPFVNGLVTLDETPGQAGSYPLVSDEANIDKAGLKGVDALLVEFGAYDRAVLDVVFNLNIPTTPTGYKYGAFLPMELPSSDAAVNAQYEDVPDDTVAPTYRTGTRLTY